MPDPVERIGEIPFSSQRMRMLVLARSANGVVSLVKGAPEHVLEIRRTVRSGPEASAPCDAKQRARVLAAADEIGTRGLRVIALALCPGRPAPRQKSWSSSASSA